MRLSRAPRRYPVAALRLLGLVRWLGTSVWPGRLTYRWWLAHGGLQGVEHELPLPGLPEGLDGLRLVQISDLHAGPFLDERALAPVVDLVNAYRPDVLAITGDFITDRAEDVHALGSVFARMPARLGAFAVFGNHDYRHRREGHIAAVLRRQGVTVLRNASARVERGGAALRVAGLEDIEEGKRSDLGAALSDRRDDEALTVLLCHHPGVAELLPPGSAQLVLCGHTHGGQVVLPLVGPLARRDAPQLAGLRALPDGTLCHVNRGLGVLVLPLRVGARAEVSCLTLRRAPAPSGDRS